MKTLTNKEEVLFYQIFQVNQFDLKRFLIKELDKYYTNIIIKPKYIIAEGNIPVVLMSHMDTVFLKPPVNIYYDSRVNVMWSPEGLGADDRAGIFSIIKLLRRGYLPSIIFTTDEELGCLGAKKLIKDITNPIVPVNFIIELDRRGEQDCVFYNCNNPEFQEYIESFGFLFNVGSYSDISIICPDWGIAGVNLSIGYEDEHSKQETLNITNMFNTIEKVSKILDEAKDGKTELYKFIPAEDAYSTIHQCEHCKDYLYDFELIPINIKGDVKWFCPDCFANIFSTCKTCGKVFVKNGGKLCLKCKKNIL